MFIKPHVKLVYCYFGNGIALGAYGPKEEIEATLNVLYNYKAHDDQARYLSDTFGYVLTNKDQLLRGLANGFVTELQSEKMDEPRAARKGIWELAQVKASEAFEKLEPEPFLSGATPGREYQVWKP